METIRFDDIEKLKSKVGEEFSDWSQPIEVTQNKINQFADVTGDHQWIHIDVERAKRESPFKGPVAHGFLTLSLLGARLRKRLRSLIVGFHAVIRAFGKQGAVVNKKRRPLAELNRRGLAAQSSTDLGEFA